MKVMIAENRLSLERFVLKGKKITVRVELDREENKDMFELLMDAHRDNREVYFSAQFSPESISEQDAVIFRAKKEIIEELEMNYGLEKKIGKIKEDC